MDVDISKLNRNRTLLGGVAAVLLVASVLFFPWYALDGSPQRTVGPDFNTEAFICGNSDFKCTGFETFPIGRWVMLLAALAPIFLAYILVRGHKLSWAPGEATMVIGAAVTALILYNGIIDKPGTGLAEGGIHLQWGYFVALLSGFAITITGFGRSQESGGKQGRKAPGTV